MGEYETHWDRRAALGESSFDPYEGSKPTEVREPRKGFCTRGYLPHVDLALTQFITFRLHDSFPASRLERWRAELGAMDEEERRRETYRRTEAYVDSGRGACCLQNPEVARIVEDQIRYHDGVRYDLQAWTLMPNHVHLLATIWEGFLLPKVVQSWKARSARQVNERLGRKGPFWGRDYYDRYVRDASHLANCLRYIDMDPVKAGLCTEPSQWAWGSARFAAGTGEAPSATRRSQGDSQ